MIPRLLYRKFNAAQSRFLNRSLIRANRRIVREVFYKVRPCKGLRFVHSLGVFASRGVDANDVALVNEKGSRK